MSAYKRIEIFEKANLVMVIEFVPDAVWPYRVRMAGPRSNCIDGESMLDTNDVYIYGLTLVHALGGALLQYSNREQELPMQPRLPFRDWLSVAA